MISKAAGLSKDEISALRSALQASQAENKQLKAQNKALKEALQKLSKHSASQSRQIQKSAVGRVKSAVSKAQQMKVNLPRQHAAKVNAAKVKIHNERTARQNMLKRMTSDQKRQYYMNTIYLPQFIERLDNFFGISGKFSDEQKQMLRQVLPRFTKEQLETVIRDNLGLETIMYESEGNYSYDDINKNLDAEDIFNNIMKAAKDLSILNTAELAYLDSLIQEGLSTEQAQDITLKFHEAAQNIDPTIAEAVAVATKGDKKTINFYRQNTIKKTATYIKDPVSGKEVLNTVRVRSRHIPRKHKHR